MTATVVGVAGWDPATHEPHEMHHPERTWVETNCYVDVWIELLWALGAAPEAAMAFSLAAGFEDPQWRFVKPPLQDLEQLWGVKVGEMNLWRPVIDHVVEQLALGRLLTVEVDAWWLPDTAGVSYREQHAKTTIVPAALDRDGRELWYLHGAGCHRLAGPDFDGLFAPVELPPYVELIRVGRFVADPEGLVDTAVEQARRHLSSQQEPPGAAVTRLGEQLAADVAELAGDDEAFHRYAFGTCRQMGASAALAASFCGWLAGRLAVPRPGTPPLPGRDPVAELVAAGSAFGAASEAAKALQFTLARVVRGRRGDLDAATAAVARAWSEGLSLTAGALR